MPTRGQLLPELPAGWTAERLRLEVDALGPLLLGNRLRPTRGLFVALVAPVVLLGLEDVTDGRWLSLGAAASLALSAVALLLRPRLAMLEVTRDDVHGGAVGDVVETTLQVHNPGPRRTPPTLAVDELPGHSTLRLAVPALEPGARTAVTAPREVLSRGRRLAGVVHLTATSPVGLLVARRDVLLAGQVVVRPALVPVHAAGRTSRAAAPPEGSGGDGRRPVAGVGGEVLGLRPWRSGDAARALSARASARHGRPLVLEREREQEPPMVVLVAAGGGGHVWEAQLSAAAALTVDAVRTGRPVELLGPPCPPHPTPGQVLDAFAAADWAPPLDDAGAARAARTAGPGGQVVLVAPSGAPDALAAAARTLRAARCDVVVVDA